MSSRDLIEKARAVIKQDGFSVSNLQRKLWLNYPQAKHLAELVREEARLTDLRNQAHLESKQ